MNRRLSGALDVARWAAALLVLLAHTATVMLARLAVTPHAGRSPLLYLWVFLAGFGHQSVTIFFVLSGFLVGGRLLDRAAHTGSIEWKRYFIDRTARVYLVLIPTLALTVLADRVSVRLTPVRMHEFVTLHTSWLALFGNLANLQDLWVPFFGSDGPIGTLANEFWYYVTFPVLLGVVLVRYKPSVRAVLFVLGVALCVVMSWHLPQHFLGFLIWGVGAAVARFRKPLMRSLPLATSLVFVALLGIRATVRGDSDNMWKLFLSDVVLSFAFANLMLVLRFSQEPAESRLYKPVHAKLAGFSFSLYAIHKPLLYLLTGLTVHSLGFGDVQVATGWRWGVVFGVLALIVAISYLFSLFTEAKTATVRHWAYRVFNATRVKLPDGPGEGAVRRHAALGQEPGC